MSFDIAKYPTTALVDSIRGVAPVAKREPAEAM